MRVVVLLLVGMVESGCGGQPALANAPRPDPAAVAGAAAAAAAAMTLADPDAATRKPEKRQNQRKDAVEVKESVPADVLDRLDHAEASGSDASGSAAGASLAASASHAPANARAPEKPRTGPPPKLPSPREAVDPGAQPDAHPDAPGRR